MAVIGPDTPGKGGAVPGIWSSLSPTPTTQRRAASNETRILQVGEPGCWRQAPTCSSHDPL